jgi:dTDP-4-amino-4,6-dideoxygalactose transaminase
LLVAQRRIHTVKEPFVPVLRPQLPQAEKLLPYLKRIDQSRTYANWGPLVCEFEARLAGHFALPSNSVVSASSGTSALVGAILASAGRAGPERPLAIVPALTFVATAIAIEQCGYRPYVVDVDPATWLLQPEHLNQIPILDRVGLIVPVAAYGRPVHQDAWHAFQQRTQIPVVIDAAPGFESISADSSRCLGAIPVAMSFHATKSFATGEGGAVATTNPALSQRVVEALNFGFYGTRDSRSPSTNGKMSEYHAAVGLAELDSWPEKRSGLHAVAAAYRRLFAPLGLAERLHAAPRVAGCYVLLRCVDRLEVDHVQRDLRDDNIEFRFWYGGGLLQQSYFSDLPHEPLPVTDAIAPLTIGLPVAADLTEATIERIVAVSAKGVTRASFRV